MPSYPMIHTYKLLTGSKTTEALLKIPEVPDYMCPKIDKIITSLRSSIIDLEYASKECFDKCYYSIKDSIESALWDLSVEPSLEELRKEIDLLRTWGETWKEIAKGYLEKDASFFEAIKETLDKNNL